MITVVIAAKDEEASIVETVRQISQSLADVKHEILVIDDGSSDRTATLARDAGATVVSHVHNLGYGSALKTGIRHARFDTIVITDADGTYPNQMIPALLQEYRKGFDMIVGARTGPHYTESVFKAPLRLLLKLLVEFTCGRRVPDVNSGLRVFSKSKTLPFINHLSNSFSFTTSVTLAYMMNNLFVAYVSIPYYKRTGKSKVRMFRDTLRTLQYIFEAITYYNPLKIFLLLSALVSGASLASLVLAPFFGLAILYYAGIGGLLTSVQIFCMGLVAVLLRQILAKE